MIMLCQADKSAVSIETVAKTKELKRSPFMGQ